MALPVPSQYKYVVLPIQDDCYEYKAILQQYEYRF